MNSRTELYAYKLPKRSRFLTFLLALMIAIFAGTWLIQHTVLDRNFVQQELEASDGYQEFTDQLNLVLNSQAEQAGIPKATLTNIATKADVKKVISTTLDNVYQHQSDPISVQPILDEINTEVREKMASVSTVAGVSSTAVSESVQESFQSYVTLRAQPIANRAVVILTDLESVAKIAVIVSAVLAAVFAIAILFRSHWHLHGWRYLFWGLFWGGALVALPGAILRFSDLIVDIADMTRSFSSIILTFLSDTLMVFVRVGGLIAGVGLLGVLLCIALPSFFHRNRRSI